MGARFETNRKTITRQPSAQGQHKSLHRTILTKDQKPATSYLSVSLPQGFWLKKIKLGGCMGSRTKIAQTCIINNHDKGT